jgi:hypothetical protein
MQTAPNALDIRKLNAQIPRLLQEASGPRIAVCIVGSLADGGTYRASAEAVLRQDYPGHIVLVISENVPLDITFVNEACVNEGRSVATVRRRDLSLTLGCNPAIEVALELEPAVEFVAILGSGETAPPRWLSSLLGAQQDFDADLVQGALKAVFKEPPPNWVLEGGFFDRCGTKRGPIARISARDNLLVRASALRFLLPRLRHSAPTGQEDEWAILEQSLRTSLLTSVWANDALVFDVVPRSRMTAEWLIEREYQKGFSAARVQTADQGQHANRTPRSRIVALALQMAELAFRGIGHIDRARSVEARLMLARARGLMAGSMSRDARKERTE